MREDTVVRIKAYCENDRHAWDQFVYKNNDASFFHLIDFKNVIEDSFGHRPHYMMALYKNQIKGVLPLFEIKSRLFGHSLVSLPFVVYGGICAEDFDTEMLLLKSAATLGRLMGVDYVEMRCQNHLINRAGHASLENTGDHVWLNKDLYVTFQREIYSDIESNFKAIPRKQRRMIRQGTKSGFISKVGGMEYLLDFYSIYTKSLKNLGTPVFSYKYLENIMKKFQGTFILTVWKDNVMVAGVMTFVFKDRLMPYFSGALKEYYQYAVNDFMYWELMKYGCEKGCRIFDFGRSKKGTGSYDFKKHWGFEPRALPYKYYLAKKRKVPNISPANPKYSTMINIWRKLPLRVANWLGPKINRYIP